MDIYQLKIDLCNTIDIAYAAAIAENQDEIIQPFAIAIKPNGQIEYLSLKPMKPREKVLH
jgi:hypothetical protein